VGVVEQLTLVINANTKTAIANLRTYDRQTGQTSLATTKLQNVFGKAQNIFAKMRDVMQGPIAALKQIGQVISQGLQYYDGLVMRAAEAEKAMSSLSAVLASTGGVAGMSFDALKQLGAGLAANTLFDPAQVIQAEAVLLTFKEIGQNAFPTAMRAAADMATVMDQDLKTTIVQVGKALNDPIKGVTALRKVGVQLTESQIAQIKGFMDVNDVASAQSVILKELQSEFGGAARAAANTATGMYLNMKKAADEAKESWGKFLAFIGKDTQGCI
jgi:phage-related minor tail protein